MKMKTDICDFSKQSALFFLQQTCFLLHVKLEQTFL